MASQARQLERFLIGGRCDRERGIDILRRAAILSDGGNAYRLTVHEQHRQIEMIRINYLILLHFSA
jgi:hypothetical protein